MPSQLKIRKLQYFIFLCGFQHTYNDDINCRVRAFLTPRFPRSIAGRRTRRPGARLNNSKNNRTTVNNLHIKNLFELPDAEILEVLEAFRLYIQQYRIATISCFYHD